MNKKDFNFVKRVIVKLVNPSPTDYLSNHMDFFKKKLNEQNERSLQSLTNRRFVEIVLDEKINSDCIMLDIYSEVELGIPGRAFTGFSRSLVPKDNNTKDYDPFFKENLFHGKLLEFETVLENDSDEIELSNEKMLQLLIHLVFLPQSTLSEKKKKAIKQIKNILINSGIYNPETMDGGR